MDGWYREIWVLYAKCDRCSKRLFCEMGVRWEDYTDLYDGVLFIRQKKTYCFDCEPLCVNCGHGTLYDEKKKVFRHFNNGVCGAHHCLCRKAKVITGKPPVYENCKKCGIKTNVHYLDNGFCSRC